MEYLTRLNIIEINQIILGSVPIIINEGALTEAVERPSAILFGHEIEETIEEKVYVLAVSIAQGHPFVDGNKRTATKAVNEFLVRNGRPIDLEHQGTLVTTINQLADIVPIARENFIVIVSGIIPPIE